MDRTFQDFKKKQDDGLGLAHQKLENGRIGTLEAPPQLRTTSERSSGLLSVAWKACQAAVKQEKA